MENDNTRIYQQTQPIQQQEEGFDYKALFFKLYRHWYFFILTIVVALIIAFLFNKYTKPVYEVSTTVIIKSDRGNKIDPQQLIGLGFRNDLQNIENEIGVLTSYSLTERTIRNLDFFVAYFEEENFISKELYGNSPYEVVFDTSHLQPVNVEFKVTILSSSKYTIQAEYENVKLYSYSQFKESDQEYPFFKINDTLYFGEQLENEACSFHIVPNPRVKESNLAGKKLAFVFKDLKSLVGRYQGLNIEPINKDASILKISLRGFNEAKAVAFLNMLTREYLAQGLEKKNLIASNTIRFIDEQLMDISDSLNYAEMELQDYRSQNIVMDIDFQSQQAVDYMKTLETQKADLSIKNMYYKSLKKYVETNKDVQQGLIVPSAMGIEDPLTTSLIQELSTLFNERAEALLTSTEKNPTIIAYDLRIENTKNALLENITNIVKNSDLTLKDINSRINALTDQMTNIPKTQRELLGITRKFTLSDNIYNFLQQRRAEVSL
ncbi:MAG TPA: Wzz/FepE/Etk N-terminal domain-containing protein [Bacteroidales bacterium]|nr:Wzz/FepE/Etk N-terminal domain-containing protein [Bacteroidales bacterium]